MQNGGHRGGARHKSNVSLNISVRFVIVPAECGVTETTFRSLNAASDTTASPRHRNLSSDERSSLGDPRAPDACAQAGRRRDFTAPEASSLIIECSHCHARYEYDSARFAGKPSRKIRCARCSEIFEIRNPELATASATSSAPAIKEVADNTMVRGRRSYAGTSKDAVPEIEEEEPESSGAYAAPLELPKDKRFSLAITDGADAAKVFRIDRARVTLGRSGADIILNDVETSREHAALEVRGGAVYLEDLGSTNGTFVGGSRITGQVELQNHQEFVVGTTTLMLIVTSLE